MPDTEVSEVSKNVDSVDSTEVVDITDIAETASTKKPLLTNSRLAAMRSCPRRHFYRYELGLTRSRSETPLRFGGVFHAGLEAYRTCKSSDQAIDKATAGYAIVPDWADPLDWGYECETVRNLLAGHFWRYGDDNLEFVAIERPFEIPLVNPASMRPSRSFLLAGKIDAIVKLPDGRLAVLEYKTSSEDIGTDSEYWRRLRCDQQISLYVIGARALGFDVATVIYDVTRKPTISQTQVAELDAEGIKIVVDTAGNRVYNANGKPRQTGDTAQGYTLKSRPMTVEEWGKKLLDDIGARPDFYFARREIPRLEDELEDFRLELWQQAGALREAQKTGRWFRNVGRMTCGHCQYADLCLNSIKVNPDAPPAGFEILADVHPELQTGGDAQGEN